MFFAICIAAPAHAETGYRYWSYWLHSDTGWSAAQTGAGSVLLEEGQLQGWRYISAGADVTDAFAPRSQEATFESVCGSTPAVAGKVRVAVVVDFGDATDYPTGETPAATIEKCVSEVAGDPSTVALADVVSVREASGMVCGLNDLPKAGCGEAFEVATPVAVAAAPYDAGLPAATQESSNDWLPTVVTTILGFVVLIMAWRRMQWQKEKQRKL